MPVTASVEWNAGATGFLLDGVSISATAISPTEPCVLDTRPPVESLGAWYQNGPLGNTNQLLTFSAPVDTLCQIDYDWVPNNMEPAYGNFAVAAGAAGLFFANNPFATATIVDPLNRL